MDPVGNIESPLDRLLQSRIDRRRMLAGTAVAGVAAMGSPAWLVSAFGPSRTALRPSQGPASRSAPYGLVGPSTYTEPLQISPPAGKPSELGYPFGLFPVPGGPVYVADFGSPNGGLPGRILGVDRTSGQVTRYVFDNTWPTDVAVDSQGTVYIADYGWDDDEDPGSLYVTGGLEDGRILGVPTADLGSGSHPVQLTTAALYDPTYLLLDDLRGVLYASTGGEANGSSSSLSGTVLAFPLSRRNGLSLGEPLTLAGTGDPVSGPVAQPIFDQRGVDVTIYVAFGLAKFRRWLYIADEYSNVVYRLDVVSGLMSTYAGTGSPSGSAGDSGPALDASVALPQGLAVDGVGNLYILQINGDIRRVDAKRPHVITTVSSIGACTDNVDLEFDTVSGSLWAIYNSGPQTCEAPSSRCRT